MKTSKILIDTSTLFSGLGWSGTPFKVLKKISESQYELVLTDYILDELFRNLQEFPTERKEPALRSFRFLKDAVVIEEKEWEENIKNAEKLVEDKKDAPILAAYLLDTVDILVTSNKKDFPYNKYENILTPDEFLEIDDVRLS